MGDVDVIFCDHCDCLFLTTAELEKHVTEVHSKPASPIQVRSKSDNISLGCVPYKLGTGTVT